MMIKKNNLYIKPQTKNVYIDVNNIWTTKIKTVLLYLYSFKWFKLKLIYLATTQECNNYCMS